jgi:putative nucleotidyltransferase with HDIG domain
VTKSRILFVDDEPHVLDGLRNVLRWERKRWDMVFAPDGSAALDELSRGSFDVVVTDMRMPGIDGAALLREIKKQYPGVTRMVLSGHADQDAIVRALPVSHQFLSKPCDSDVIKAAIERACDLQTLLRGDAIQAVVGRLDRLPSPPRTYHELTEVLAEPDNGVGRIVAVVERDPALCAKILRLVNSSNLGLARTATSVHQAVLYLGVSVLRVLVLTVDAFGANGVPAELLDLERLQDHSVVVARLASQFTADRKRAEEAFSAGLVHDIGKIVLALAWPEEYREIRQQAATRQTPQHLIERDRIGVTHAEVGAYLLGVWGLPLGIVEAVAHHHAPSGVTQGDRSVLGAVHAAEGFTAGGTAPIVEAGLDDRLDARFFGESGLGADLKHWRSIAAREPSVGRDPDSTD